jgi:pyruvyltransferase
MTGLWWWKNGSERNFGDELSLHILRGHGIDVEWAELSSAEIVGAGSVLEILYNSHAKGTTVLSSGFIREGRLRDPSQFNFLAVRGKLTQGMLGGIDVPLGDLGLLACDLICDCINYDPKGPIGIFPHYVDRDHPSVQALRNNDDYLVMDSSENCAITLQEMARCRIVLSSSLHGLIAADSLGVPSKRVIITGKLTGGDFKFRDYYSAIVDEPLVNGTAFGLSLDNPDLFRFCQGNPQTFRMANSNLVQDQGIQRAKDRLREAIRGISQP